MLKKYQEKFIIVAFIISIIIPPFGYTIDRIGNQWFYLSLVLCLSSLLYFIKGDINLFKIYIDSSLPNKAIIWLLLFFVFFAIFSIVPANNKIESLVVISQYITIFLSLFILIIISKKTNNYYNFIFLTFYILLIIEIYFVMLPIINDVSQGNYIMRSTLYKGLMSNINITSFSLLYKIPILFYFFDKSKNKLASFFHLFIFLCVLSSILILGSRASYIALGFMLFIRMGLLFFHKESIFKSKFKLIGYSFTILISIILNIAFNSESNFIDRTSEINFDANNSSNNQRLNYYDISLQLIRDNPLLGIGVGNWKYESIPLNRFDMSGYIVPYYAHNDFLQIFSETGLFGLLSYVLIFISIAYIVLKNFKNIEYFYIGCFFIAYTIDSLLNFPIGRVVSLIHFIFFISLIFSLNQKYNEK